MAVGRVGHQHLATLAHQAQAYRQMLDEIREQRLLVRDLRIERVLIAGARALYGAGMARRGNRQLRPQPGVFLAKQGNLFGLLDHGGWGGALGGGEGTARRWRGRRCCWGS